MRVYLHSRTWFLYFIMVIVILMTFWHPVLLLISLESGLLWWRILGRRLTAGHIFAALAIIGLLTVANPLISSNGATILFYLNGRAITTEALAYGFLFASVLVCTLLWCVILSDVMTTDRWLNVCGRRFWRTGLVLTMVFRFFPLFTKQWQKIREGQEALEGGSPVGLKETFRMTKRELLCMLTWSLEHGFVTADAMLARGYGAARRTFFNRENYGATSIGIALAIAAAFAAVITAAASGGLEAQIYPYVRIHMDGGFDILGFAAFFLLCHLPMISYKVIREERRMRS